MEKVVFTFGWDEKDHPIPPGSTTIEITLHPEGDKTRVRLVHRGLPADAVDDHGEGWAHYLERLALAATGGDPGPDVIADVADDRPRGRHAGRGAARSAHPRCRRVRCRRPRVDLAPAQSAPTLRG